MKFILWRYTKKTSHGLFTKPPKILGILKTKPELIFVLPLCLILSGLFYGQVHGAPLILVTLESPPAEFSLNGEGAGRNVEIAREGLKRMGFDSVVRILPWKRALIMVEKGGADAIIDAAYTRERARFLFYPDEEIYVEEWYLFRRTGNPITVDRDLGNAGLFSLGVSRGFEYGGLIQEAIDNRLFKEIQAVTGNQMNIRKLAGNRFDLFVGVKLTVLYLAKQMGYGDQIEVVPMTETGKPYLLSASKTYLAFSRKTMTADMADRFSQVLVQMKADGTIKKIETKYN